MLAAVGFAVAVGFGIVAPALPVYARQFGVDRTAAGVVISVFAVMRIVSAPFVGRLVDRFGERRVLATGIGIVAVSSALAGLAGSYPELVVLRGFGGLGSAMFSVSGMTLLLRSVSAGQRGRATGMYSGAFLVGGITGPALGGVVTGVSIRLPFFLYAGTLVVAGGIGLRQLRPRVGSATGGGAAPGPRTSFRSALRHPAYRAALAANLADNWASIGVRSALIPLFVVDVLHRSSLVTGAAFVTVAVVNAAVLLPAGRLADTIGRRPILVVGLSFSAIALGLLAVVPGVTGLFVAMAVLGFGSGLLDVAPAAIVGDVAGNRGGTLVAGYQMSGDLGTVAGPVVAGHLADVAGYGVAFGASAGLVGLVAVLAATAPETRTATGPAAPPVVAEVGGSAHPVSPTPPPDPR